METCFSFSEADTVPLMKELDKGTLAFAEYDGKRLLGISCWEMPALKVWVRDPSHIIFHPCAPGPKYPVQKNNPILYFPTHIDKYYIPWKHFTTVIENGIKDGIQMFSLSQTKRRSQPIIVSSSTKTAAEAKSVEDFMGEAHCQPGSEIWRLGRIQPLPGNMDPRIKKALAESLQASQADVDPQLETKKRKRGELERKRPKTTLGKKRKAERQLLRNDEEDEDVEKAIRASIEEQLTQPATFRRRQQRSRGRRREPIDLGGEGEGDLEQALQASRDTLAKERAAEKLAQEEADLEFALALAEEG